MESFMFFEYPLESVRYFSGVLAFGHIFGPLSMIMSAAVIYMTHGVELTCMESILRFMIALRVVASALQLPLRFLMSYVIYKAGQEPSRDAVAQRLLNMTAQPVWRLSTKVGFGINLLLPMSVVFYVLDLGAGNLPTDFLPEAFSEALAIVAGSTTSLMSVATNIIISPCAIIPSPVASMFFSCVSRMPVHGYSASLLLSRATLAQICLSALNYLVSICLLLRTVFAADAARGPSILADRSSKPTTAALLAQHSIAAPAGAFPESLTKKMAKMDESSCSNSNATEAGVVSPLSPLVSPLRSPMLCSQVPKNAGVPESPASSVAPSVSARAVSCSTPSAALPVVGGTTGACEAPAAAAATSADACATAQAGTCSGSSGGTECTICYSGYGFRSLSRVLRCGHIYHEECITRWLRRAKHCPTCHYVLGEKWFGEGASAPFAGAVREAVEKAASVIGMVSDAETDWNAEAAAGATSSDETGIEVLGEFDAAEDAALMAARSSAARAAEAEESDGGVRRRPVIVSA